MIEEGVPFNITPASWPTTYFSGVKTTGSTFPNVDAAIIEALKVKGPLLYELRDRIWNLRDFQRL